jgi:hypothetical protein
MQVGSGQSAVGNWEEIGFVPGFGTTTEPRSYSFIDVLSLTPNLPAGRQGLTHTLRYRLKQIDFDGSFEYSDVVAVEIISPVKFSLEQNYPNPFNPTTKIKYTVPVTLSEVEGSLVTLKVYDVLGNEIATLVNEEKPAGSYEVEFDGNNLPSGIYFYQLQAGQFTQTKKMLLIK